MDNNKIIQEIVTHLIEAVSKAKSLGYENILYNERYVELMMANILGHKYENHTQGGDAIETVNGVECPTEYKSINIQGKNGVVKGSFQFHWLSDEKIAKYRETKNMYFCIRDGIEILEIYQVNTDIIMPLLESKKSGSTSIHGHAGISLKKAIKEFNAVKIYDSKNQTNTQ